MKESVSSMEKEVKMRNYCWSVSRRARGGFSLVKQCWTCSFSSLWGTRRERRKIFLDKFGHIALNLCLEARKLWASDISSCLPLRVLRRHNLFWFPFEPFPCIYLGIGRVLKMIILVAFDDWRSANFQETAPFRPLLLVWMVVELDIVYLQGVYRVLCCCFSSFMY